MDKPIRTNAISKRGDSKKVAWNVWNTKYLREFAYNDVVVASWDAIGRDGYNPIGRRMENVPMDSYASCPCTISSACLSLL